MEAKFQVHPRASQHITMVKIFFLLNRYLLFFAITFGLEMKTMCTLKIQDR